MFRFPLMFTYGIYFTNHLLSLGLIQPHVITFLPPDFTVLLCILFCCFLQFFLAYFLALVTLFWIQRSIHFSDISMRLISTRSSFAFGYRFSNKTYLAFWSWFSTNPKENQLWNQKWVDMGLSTSSHNNIHAEETTIPYFGFALILYWRLWNLSEGVSEW